MKRKCTHLSLRIISVLTLYSLLILNMNASAYVLTNNGFSSVNNLVVDYYGLNATWTDYLYRGLWSWNDTNTKANFTTWTDGEDIKVNLSNKDSGVYGVCTTYKNLLGKTTSATISLNTENINEHADSGKLEIFVRSVFTHELGHCLSLGDFNDSAHPKKAIMNYARNRNYLKKPQADDVNGVNQKYGTP